MSKNTHSIATFRTLLIAAMAFQLLNLQAYAWGQQGHAIVTRVAVRLLGERVKEEDKSSSKVHPFLKKELMLAHLSNIPDVSWKSLSKDVTRELNPSHWIDADYLGFKPGDKIKPLSYRQALQAAKKNCKTSGIGERLSCDLGIEKKEDRKKWAAVFGTAPYRIAQLHKQMVGHLKKVGKVENSKLTKSQVTTVNKALVTAGIMAHFVGNLSQPMHTTKDYNGFDSGAGGLHAYFESDAVNEMPFEVLSETHQKASFVKNFLIQKLTKEERSEKSHALSISFALVSDSFSLLPTLYKIDKEHALLKPSEVNKDGLKIYAKRKPVSQTAAEFQNFAASRMAMGAAVLAELYYEAWKQAGKPDLSSFQSYFYTLDADPVMLDYL